MPIDIFQNRRPQRPFVIAHRGARSSFPENTVASIEGALRMDVAGVEFDVDLAGDRVPIVVHQETLEPDESGAVLRLAKLEESRAWTFQMDSRRIKSLDAGMWFGRQFAGERIPLLSEVLALDWSKHFMIMEIKDPYYWVDTSKDASALPLADAMQASLIGMLSAGMQLAVLSFSPYLLKILSRRFPGLPLIFALWTDRVGKIEATLDLAAEAGAAAVVMADFMLIEDPAWMDAAHERDLLVQVYELTPDNYHSMDKWNPAAKESAWQALRKLSPHAITSDFPLELRAFLG